MTIETCFSVIVGKPFHLWPSDSFFPINMYRHVLYPFQSMLPCILWQRKLLQLPRSGKRSDIGIVIWSVRKYEMPSPLKWDYRSLCLFPCLQPNRIHMEKYLFVTIPFPLVGIGTCRKKRLWIDIKNLIFDF